VDSARAALPRRGRRERARGPWMRRSCARWPAAPPDWLVPHGFASQRMGGGERGRVGRARSDWNARAPSKKLGNARCHEKWERAVLHGKSRASGSSRISGLRSLQHVI